MQRPAFSPGFRLSALDIVVIAVSIVTSLWLASMTWWWGFGVGFVVAHFSLFCNVFRIARPLEIAWAIAFIALAGATITQGNPGWPGTVAISLAVTAMAVVLEMRKPSYHGVGWQWINPNLPDWWAAHVEHQSGMQHPQ